MTKMLTTYRWDGNYVQTRELIAHFGKLTLMVGWHRDVNWRNPDMRLNRWWSLCHRITEADGWSAYRAWVSGAIGPYIGFVGGYWTLTEGICRRRPARGAAK